MGYLVNGLVGWWIRWLIGQLMACWVGSSVDQVGTCVQRLQPALRPIHWLVIRLRAYRITAINRPIGWLM
jgi:hypothetical protein